MSSTRQYILPDLISLCPFPYSSNPHCEKAGAESAAWLESYDIFRDRKRAFFAILCAELLVSRAYPYTGYEEARTCCDMLNILFIIDEISDDQDGAGARKTGDIFLKSMGDAPCDGSPLSRITKEQVCCCTLSVIAHRGLRYRRFRERLFKKAPLKARQRFVQHCADYIDAVAREARLRQQGEVLGLQEYTLLRRENSGVRPCFAFFEYVHAIDLPDEVFEDPVFMRLYYAAVDMICWANVRKYDRRSARIDN